MMDLSPYPLDTLANQWIVCTSEDQCFDISRKLRKVLTKEYVYLFSLCDPLLNKRNESWCTYFFDDHTIIEDMYSFLVHTSTHCCLSCENSYLLVSTIDHCLSSWNGHSEDMSPDEYLLLHRTECMNTCSIAGKYNYISSSVKEPPYSSIRQLTYLTVTPTTIWRMLPIHLEYHSNIWILLLKSTHYYLSPESGIKKSENHKKKSGSYFPDFMIKILFCNKIISPLRRTFLYFSTSCDRRTL